MAKLKFKLKECMKDSDRRALGNLPTTHKNCIDKTGVARPGKTNRERMKREQSQ